MRTCACCGRTQDDIKTGEHFSGDKKRAFLDKFIEVLKRG